MIHLALYESYYVSTRHNTAYASVSSIRTILYRLGKSQVKACAWTLYK